MRRRNSQATNQAHHYMASDISTISFGEDNSSQTPLRASSRSTTPRYIRRPLPPIPAEAQLQQSQVVIPPPYTLRDMEQIWNVNRGFTPDGMANIANGSLHGSPESYTHTNSQFHGPWQEHVYATMTRGGTPGPSSSSSVQQPGAPVQQPGAPVTSPPSGAHQEGHDFDPNEPPPPYDSIAKDRLVLSWNTQHLDTSFQSTV